MKKIVTLLVAVLLVGCSTPQTFTAKRLLSPRAASQVPRKAVPQKFGLIQAVKPGPRIHTFSATQAQLRTLKATWDPYLIPPGGSNAVITIYKSISLGTVFTPYKPTAFTSATRTNISFPCLLGLYHFYATATVQPYGESDPSNICTNNVQ